MALPMDIERISTFGISSPYDSIDQLLGPINEYGKSTPISSISTAPIKDIPAILWNVQNYQRSIGVGYSGWGVDTHLIPSLAPSLVWFVAFVLIRYICHEPLAMIGVYLGVVTEDESKQAARRAQGKRGTQALSSRDRKLVFKFQNQLWLTFFYIASTIIGLRAQIDKPWFALPMDEVNRLHLFVPHPYNPSADMIFYYNYGLGFYFAELFSLLFVERRVKRSDFVEYVVHHFTTINLVVFSHLAWEHRIGVYVLFLHDASDIMLSVSKSLHYIVAGDAAREKRYNKLHHQLQDGKRYVRPFLYTVLDRLASFCLVLFVVGFFFMRLYCLPVVGCAILRTMPRLHHGNFSLCMLAIMLGAVLQALHFYWASLIISLIIKMVRGEERKDIRSDDDLDDEDEMSLIADDAPTHLRTTAQVTEKNVLTAKTKAKTPSPSPRSDSKSRHDTKKRA